MILSPTQIKSLEHLGENDRREALLRLGAPQIRRAQDDWRRLGSEIFDRRKQLLDDQDHFHAITESREERREYEKKIADTEIDIKQADLIVEILDRYLAIVESAEVESALVGHAEELHKHNEAGTALRRLNEALKALAAILSEINQHNGKALTINPHLPSDCQQIPIFDVRVDRFGGDSSLVRWLTSLFPIYGVEIQQVAAAYPGPVKAALAKLEEQRRAQIAAARKRHFHVDPESPMGSAVKNVHVFRGIAGSDD